MMDDNNNINSTKHDHKDVQHASTSTAAIKREVDHVWPGSKKLRRDSAHGAELNLEPCSSIASVICCSVPSVTGVPRPSPPRGKVSQKAARRSNGGSGTPHPAHAPERISSASLVAHSRCVYLPGAFSNGKQSKCSLYHCCHCQHPVSRFARMPSSLTDPTTTASSSLLDRPCNASERVESLVEMSARVVAEHLPYEYIEQRYRCIPEPVQRRILFWSFPRDESYIRLYSSISSIFKDDSHLSTDNFALGSNSNIVPMAMNDLIGGPELGGVPPFVSANSAHQQSPAARQSVSSSSLFNLGLTLMFYRAVHQVLQVGFNLTGVVTNVTPLNSIASATCPFYSSSALPSSSGSSVQAGPSHGQYSQSLALAGPASSRDSSPFRKVNNLVSITFDRCKITSVTCTCNSRDHHLFWCEHVVALALYRIRKPYAVELRVPISDTLHEFDREQLQKLVQYLIAEHHVQILPTVQRLSDDLLNKRSHINLLAGAPDPTAGACTFGRHDWYLNEEKIKAQIRDLVRSVSMIESKQIILLFYKVVEMLKIRDSNGPRFLRIITQQFLYSYAHYLKPEEISQRYDPFIFLWDHLTNLWIFIVTDINISAMAKIEWREMFRHWSENPNCPREDTYFWLDIGANHPDYQLRSMLREKYEKNHDSEYVRRILIPTIRRKRILERAHDATYLTWDDHNLQHILNHDGPVNRFSYYSEYFDRQGYPVWSEHLPTAAIRIASLRVNGYAKEARRLAMAVVRYLKHCHDQNKTQYQKNKVFCEFDVVPPYESWLGNPIDPIGVIFDTLAEASLASDSSSIDSIYALVGYDKKIDITPNKNLLLELFLSYNEVNERTGPRWSMLADGLDESIEVPKYRHVHVPGSTSPLDTYIASAVTVAIIGLAQHRRSPDLESQRDKSFRQEERLLRKLLDIKLDSVLIEVVREQANLLIKNGLLSDNVNLDPGTKNVPDDIAQIPGLARYLFGALLSSDPPLAYEIGLRSLKYFSLKYNRAGELEDRHDNRQDRLRKLRSNQYYYLDVQLILAKTMLFAARNDPKRLGVIFKTIQTHMTLPLYLNKLSQDIFQLSRNELTGTRHEPLLRIAYWFGLHLIKITRNDADSYRKMNVSWLVTCASELADDSLLKLMNHWREYFTPSEAVRYVATPVLSGHISLKVAQLAKLTASGSASSEAMCQQEDLVMTARKLAMECAHQDPANCAFSALALCEKDQFAFETIAKVIERAGSSNQMTPMQLFTVARYMEHHHMNERACRIALLAAAGVFIPLTADTHQSINDLQWACSLAQSLGPKQLTELVMILVKNVHCAPVLADMLKRCMQAAKQLPTPMSHRSGKNMFDSTSLVYIDLSLEDRMRGRSGGHMSKLFSLDRAPLSILLKAAVSTYMESVMARLEHISPRHYSDFIDFLTRAHETIVLAPSGKQEFVFLLDKIKNLYKGKKKLMSLVRERFG